MNLAELTVLSVREFKTRETDMDNGWRTRVEFWNGEAVVKLVFYGHTANDYGEPLGDTPETTAYRAAVKWFSGLLSARRRYVNPGDTVDVVAGRKVPKGTGYTVLREGDGNYGRYFDLRGPDGKEHRYVNTSNVRRVVPVTPYDEFLAAFEAIPSHDRERQGEHLTVFADWLQDRGNEFADRIRAYGRSLIALANSLYASWGPDGEQLGIDWSLTY